MKRRYLTLMEIMIVIVLIGLIGSVVAYNMRGSLDEGKLFKTRQGGEQIYNILNLEVARGADLNQVPTHWKEMVEHSGLARNASQICKDGWGDEYNVEVNNGEIQISSKTYDKIMQRKNSGSYQTAYFR